MRISAQQRKLLAMLAAVVVIVALWWVQQQQETAPDVAKDTSAQSAPSDSPAPSDSSSPSPSTDGVDPDSGLPTVAVADLPPEAAETLELIDAGGPFPYDRDGVTFENREDILPQQDYGYYREYTVVTPGSEDRGALRIVTGSEGEFYWTGDHYRSFSRILR